MRHFILYIIFFSFILLSQAQKKEVFAKRINSKITIDAKLNESVWKNILPAKDFTMIEPINGKIERKTQKSEVKFAYDDSGIYIAANLYDIGVGYNNKNNGIMRELGARDEEGKSADIFGLFINPFNDGINEFAFLVSAAGVQIDKRIILTTNGAVEDNNWDAIWESAISIHKDGWIVEIKIPYSALRFPNTELQEWGLNIYRELRRFREGYSWNYIDTKKGRFSNQAGTLKGIKNINPPIRLSLTPYFSNVLSDESDQSIKPYGLLSGGVDLKYGFNVALPSTEINLTLDMILLPDFQQTEFDPLILNITPFEKKYTEKRSFFTEGSELFQKGNLFYSRRIGEAPQNIEINTNERLLNPPLKTPLFNATKISGRTKDGWGIGFFNAITRNTYVDIQDTIINETYEKLIEPVTNYNMLVIDRSFNQNSFITFVNTNVNKDIRKNRGELFRNAHVFGLLGSITNKKNTLTYDGAIKGSFINDATNKKNGFSTFLNIEKINGSIKYGLQNYVESDKYDINDMGFLYQNNEINTEGFISYSIFSEDNPMAKKIGIKKGSYKFSFEHQALYNPLGYNKLIFKSNIDVVNKKHLFMRLEGRYFFQEHDYFESRNNQLFIKPPAIKGAFITSSNFNNPISLNTMISLKQSLKEGYNVWEDYLNNFLLYYRVNPRFRINNHTFLQYILAIENERNQFGWITEDNNNPLFSRRDRNSITNKLILNLTFNPKTYIKIIARHYWSTLKNKSFYTLNEFGYLENSAEHANLDINFNTWNLDFNFSWEYRPGSSLSILWQNSLTNQNDKIEEVFYSNINAFFENPTSNIFSIKFTYYLDYLNLVSKRK